LPSNHILHFVIFIKVLATRRHYHGKTNRHYLYSIDVVTIFKRLPPTSISAATDSLFSVNAREEKQKKERTFVRSFWR